MRKEVGASSQISLGKKYAGQLFDLQTAGDGGITLTPVKGGRCCPSAWHTWRCELRNALAN